MQGRRHKLTGKARQHEIILYRLACKLGDYEDARERLRHLLCWWIDCNSLRG